MAWPESRAGRRASELPAGRLEGVILDPVYEGTSMAGLIDLVTTGEIGKDSTVLYAHLGGQPAVNALQRAVSRAGTSWWSHGNGHG